MFRNLKLWQKLAIAGALAAIPMFTLMFLFLRSRDEQIARTRDELAGMDYVLSVRNLLEHLPRHRSAASAVLNGDHSMRGELLEAQSQVENAVAAVDLADKKSGKELGTTATWDSIRLRWADLKSRVLNLSPEESYGRHTRLIADILAQVRLVGDRTGLTTDPELATFYLAENLLTQMPESSEYLGQLASIGSGIAARQKMSAAEEAQVRFLNRQIGTSVELFERNFQSAFSYDNELRKKLEGMVTTASGSAAYLRNVAQQELLDANSITVQPRNYIEAGNSAVDKVWKLYDLAAVNIRDLFAQRLDRLTSQKWTQLAVALSLLGLSALFIFQIQRGITLQVRSMSRTFQEINKGDLEARAEVHGGDELGIMAQRTNEMLSNTTSLIQSREERDRIQQSIQKLLDEVSGVAAGDLTKEAEVSAEVTGAIADAFNYMLAELRAIIGNVQKTAAEVNRSALSVQSETETLAEGSQQQSAKILAATGSIESMAHSIRSVAETARAASSVAGEALSGALAGGDSVRKTIEGMTAIRQQVQETAKRMKRLGESSQEIGEIVQLISDIADRTSILALNASIQAAMAGEAGKGFAVVAEEVERLSERSTEATKRITTLIKSVQTDTNEAISAMEATTREVVGGSQVAGEAGERLQHIESVSRRIAELVGSIAHIAQDQAQGSETVAKAVAGVSHATQTTAEGARQAAAEIRSLAALVTQLNQSVSRFRLPAAQVSLKS